MKALINNLFTQAPYSFPARRQIKDIADELGICTDRYCGTHKELEQKMIISAEYQQNKREEQEAAALLKENFDLSVAHATGDFDEFA